MTAELPASPTKINRRTGKPMHPNSLANLAPPYPPGTNGNPKPGNSLKAVLLNKLTYEKQVAIADATIQGAIDLVPVAFHEVWDRV